MTPRKLLSLLCTLSLFALSVAQHGEESETVGTASEAEPLPPCARPLDELHRSIKEIFGEGYTVYINCLSFDAKGVLRLGVASGESPDSRPNLRYNIECRGDILVAEPVMDIPIDTTDIRDTSCVECDSSLTNGSCTERCDSKCERCSLSPSNCTRCTACGAEESIMCRYGNIGSDTCRVQCPGASSANHELYNLCECVPPGYRLLDDYPYAPDYIADEVEIDCEKDFLGSSTCVTQCDAGLDPHNGTGICWACGIAYCARCDRAINECLDCLDKTVPYEHECIPCPEAPIAIAALEQEHEIELEEEEQRTRAIELGISLTIVPVLIIVFFVSMSVFAHHRYPHVSYHGHKRHRKPPTEEVERSMSPTVSGDEQLPPVSHVWRPRPTIVLR